MSISHIVATYWKLPQKEEPERRIIEKIQLHTTTTTNPDTLTCYLQML